MSNVITFNLDENKIAALRIKRQKGAITLKRALSFLEREAEHLALPEVAHYIGCAALVLGEELSTAGTAPVKNA